VGEWLQKLVADIRDASANEYYRPQAGFGGNRMNVATELHNSHWCIGLPSGPQRFDQMLGVTLASM